MSINPFIQTGNPSCLLTEDEIQDEIHSCNERAEKDRQSIKSIYLFVLHTFSVVAVAFQTIDEAILGDSINDTLIALQSEHADISSLDSSSTQRYHSQLQNARETKGEVHV